MKRLAFLLLVASLSFPSLVWQFTTDGAVNAKPLVFDGMLIAASADGNVYALDPATGSKRWQAAVGMEPNGVLAFDNGVVVSTSGGTVVKLDRAGKQVWKASMNTSQYNVSRIYGASANAREVFVSASNGIYAMDKSGVPRLLMAFPNSLVTAPAAGPDYVIYGIDRTLYKLSDTRGIEWTANLEGGSFWMPAAIDNNVAYIGALDSSMHAYSVGGGQLWQARTHNWVMSTPLVAGGVAYFGSNDGRVYAVDTGSGNIRWEAQTQLAVQTTPEAGSMGGTNVIFVGGSDKSIYAINTGNGEIVWRGSAAAAVGSPLFYQGRVIFGSLDRSVYAYSTERACSITTPSEANVLGLKEVAVKGKYVSAAGGASVWVSVNGQSWEKATANNGDWAYYVDPKAKFKPGINVISCKVTDSSGQEEGDTFTSVAVNHNPNIPLSTLVVTATPAVVENAPLTIYVNDGDDGSPVERFTITVDGKTTNGNDNVTMKLAAGSYAITVKKAGFRDATVSVNVSSAGTNPAYLAVGGILILILLWRAWSSFSKGRAKRG
ncbi:MAG: PQQ-binding-like beta-propeller repeat protein [Candidatus ainarchaeum sp.]|nr:PQQ-binding-like beta-propeller repeat protein [Candidatus ainarchaeum sp.]